MSRFVPYCWICLALNVMSMTLYGQNSKGSLAKNKSALPSETKELISINLSAGAYLNSDPASNVYLSLGQVDDNLQFYNYGQISNLKINLVGGGVNFYLYQEVLLKELVVNHPDWESYIFRFSGSKPIKLGGFLRSKAGTLNTNGNLHLAVYDSLNVKFPSVYFKSACNGTDSIVGDVVVERYFRPMANGDVYASTETGTLRRAWRTYAPGVLSNESIRYSLMQNLGETLNGYGTYVIGNNANFDYTLAASSIYRYVNNNWSAVSTPLEAISRGSTGNNVWGAAYHLMVPGDRTLNLYQLPTTTNATILRSRGRLNGCAVTFSDGSNGAERINSTAGSYSLIGNPFWNYIILGGPNPFNPAQTFPGLNSTNLKATYYFANPFSSQGGYPFIPFNSIVPNQDLIINTAAGLGGTGSVLTNLNVSNNWDIQRMQPGHGIFVQHVDENSDPASLTIDPSNVSKLPNVVNNGQGSWRNISFFSNEKIPDEYDMVSRVSIRLESKMNGNFSFSDAVSVAYGQVRADNKKFTSNAVLTNSEDSEKMLYSGSPNLYVDRFKPLIIDNRSPLYQLKIDTIPLAMQFLKGQDFRLVIVPKNIDYDKEVVLLDDKKELGERGISLVSKSPLNVDSTRHYFNFKKDDEVILKRFKVLLVRDFKEFRNLYLANDENDSQGLMVYPNPSTELVKIYHKEMSGSGVEVYDMQGRLWFKKQLGANEFGPLEINLAKWAPGMYAVRLQKGKDSFVHGKIIKGN